MRGHRGVPHNRTLAIPLSRLLSYKYTAPISPLECALPQCPATVHSKELIRSAKSFRMRTYTKTGGRGSPPIFAFPSRVYCQGRIVVPTFQRSTFLCILAANR